jgi:hypothetical protein
VAFQKVLIELLNWPGRLMASTQSAYPHQQITTAVQVDVTPNSAVLDL